MQTAMELFDKIVDDRLLIRRVNISANHVIPEDEVPHMHQYEQMDLFTDYNALVKQREQKNKELEKEKAIQKTMIELKQKFGKNAILKGTNLQEGATAIDRNSQIGGHKA